jgi:hypothetical protein
MTVVYHLIRYHCTMNQKMKLNNYSRAESVR